VSGFPNREGLQPERTALAWQRTSLTALVVLLPTIVVALRDGLPVLAAGGAAAALVSTGLVLSVRRRFVQLHDWGWDFHGTGADTGITDGLRNKCRGMDRAVAALLRPRPCTL